ncbi:MAG: CHAT domain-containing protein [Armatimonadetes bacterium]|nr:CHAT domain-containing protein [Armatimonadota bacterium]
MTRRPFILLSIAVMALTIAGTPAWCQSTRARVLSQLTQANDAQLAPRVKTALANSPKETKLLGLDLIIYRWAARESGVVPDVRNINSIIKVINRESSDPTLASAERLFSVSVKSSPTAALPIAPFDGAQGDHNGAQGDTPSVILNLIQDQGDDQVSLLVELSSNFNTALAYRESRPKEAADALEAVLATCSKLQIELTNALALSELGDRYLYDAARFQQAEQCYSRAILVFSAYDCVASTARLFDNYGMLNTTLGRYAAATEDYRQAAQQWLFLAEADPSRYRYRDLAGALFMKAGETLIRQGDTPKALQLMNANGLREFRIWAYATKRYSALILNLIKIASIYRDRGDTKRAIDLLKEARKNSEASGDPMLKAKTYSELAKAYEADGNDAASASGYRSNQQVLEATASAGDAALLKLSKYPNTNQQRRNDLLKKAETGALAYQALDNLPKSVDLWQKLAPIYLKLGMVEERIDCLSAIAAVYDQRQQPAQSLSVRLDAAMYAWKAGKINLAADIVQYMVQNFIDIGDLQNALEGYTELLPIIEASGNVRLAASVFAAKGSLLLKNEQWNDAIENLQNAKRYLTQVGDSWAAAEVSLKLANAQMRNNLPEEARSTLDSMRQDIESNFSYEILDPKADPEHGAILRNIYHDLVLLLIKQGNGADASKLITQANHYMWQPDFISEMRKSNDSAISEFALRLDTTNGTGVNTNEPTEDVLLADTWWSVYEQCLMLRKQYAANYNALPADPLDVYKLRNKLPQGTSVIIYMTTASQVYALVCSQDKATCRKLKASSSAIASSITELRATLQTCEESLASGIPIPPITDWSSADFAQIKKPLEDLYSQLVQPIYDDIKGRRLLVFALPDELTGLPMHALIAPGETSAPRFLIQDYQITYLSRGMLEDLALGDKTTISPTSDRLAIFADPENNLPWALKEASAIKAIYLNSTWYLGSKATASQLMEESQSANILHIAAHHWIDPNPTKFGLRLAPDAGSSSILGVQELSSLHNDNLKLVVLSACDAIASSDPISSGPSKAAEIFSRAGAMSVMGGLWRVSDGEATAGLMTDFYRQIVKQSSKAEATGKSLNSHPKPKRSDKPKSSSSNPGSSPIHITGPALRFTATPGNRSANFHNFGRISVDTVPSQLLY